MTGIVVSTFRYLGFHFSGMAVSYLRNDGVKSTGILSYSTNIFKLKSIKKKIRRTAAWVLKPKIMYRRSVRERAFEKCRKQEILESGELKDKQLSGIVDNYKYFISGSDQVWDFQINEGHSTYFLDFIPSDQSFKKLSYAASMNCDNISEEDEKKIKFLLSDFSSVLVREQSTCDYLNDRLNIKAQKVMDPVFLVGREAWNDFADKARWGGKKPKEYLLIYIVAPGNKIFEKAVEYANRRGWDAVFLGMKSPVRINGCEYETLIDIGPYEFVDAIRNAQEIYTTSFHAVAFSIIYEKPFVYEPSPKINMARIYDLLADLGIQDRSIESDQIGDINWESVKKELNKLCSHSEELLTKSIQRALKISMG